MLFLIFQLGDDRYAIPAKQVIEVLPLVKAKRIPQSPAGLVGLFNYHGAPVPLIDLTELACGQPAGRWMSTRILVIRVPLSDAADRVVGLLVENATETLSRPEADFVDAGVGSGCYLGPVATDAEGIIQRIEIRELLSASMRTALSEDITSLHGSNQH